MWYYESAYCVNGIVHLSPPFPYENISGKITQISIEQLSQLGHDIEIVKETSSFRGHTYTHYRYLCSKCGKVFCHNHSIPINGVTYRHELSLHELKLLSNGEWSAFGTGTYHKAMDSLGPKAVMGQECKVNRTEF